jgi:flagellar hook-basal body complex protein FliE
MIDGVNNNLSIGKLPGVTNAPGAQPTPKTSFSDMLKGNIDEVARLQREASQAVQSLVTGQTEDVTGVMTAMEKSAIAFKTLLAIRAKLMDAYEEIKSVQI